MSRTIRAVVFGSVNADLVVEVARLPVPGETLRGTVRAAAGGKGANQAFALARLGAATRFVGAVGDDDAGRAALAELAATGVDTSAVRRSTRLPTGIAVVTTSAGENTIVVAAGANDAARAPAAAALAGMDLLLVSLEVPEAQVALAVARARRRGIRTVLNAAPAGTVSEATLRASDVLIVNETEALALSQRTRGVAQRARRVEPLAAGLLELGPGIVVVTLGARGSVIATRDGVETIPALPAPVVDPTGAGDCFTAAFALTWCAGASPLDSARFASAAAAHAVSRVGARAGMPTAAAVRATLRRGTIAR